jgi:hypothetical protein
MGSIGSMRDFRWIHNVKSAMVEGTGTPGHVFKVIEPAAALVNSGSFIMLENGPDPTYDPFEPLASYQDCLNAFSTL